MSITRRGWLGATAATALAAPALARGADVPPPRFQVVSPGVHDYGPALEALADYARREIAELGLPGMSLSVTDAEGYTAVLTVGVADLETREPIRPDHLFQIGSISKSFLALTILSLVDEGAVDLDASVARFLPEAPLPAEPITVRQLLSHTGGLPDDAPVFPRVPEARLWTGFVPGSRFSYSNTGFVVLGAMVERVTGLSHQTAILQRVRAKMGVADIAGDISQANRARFPKGYVPADQSRAAELPGAAMTEAKWDPETTPAGCIAATSEMMARYLRGLLNLGTGRGAPVLSDESARLFVTPLAGADEFGHGSHYALGVALQAVDGVPCLHHTGGMVAFSSSFHADPAAGVAAFASVNSRQGGYRPRQTTAYAIRLMRAARAGGAAPAAPDPWMLSRIADPAPLLGTFAAADGRVFSITAGEGFPRFAAVGDAEPLYRAGESLATPHPLYAGHSLDPVMSSGRARAFWWGEALFGRDTPPAQPAAPERLRAPATVLARGGALALDGGGRLTDRGGWWAPEKDVGGVERLRFEGMLNGRATRLNVSGIDLARL
jgi:CubicO group peptidase (beta-lactamase class C family)